jgi:hypothetical protein
MLALVQEQSWGDMRKNGHRHEVVVIPGIQQLVRRSNNNRPNDTTLPHERPAIPDIQTNSDTSIQDPLISTTDTVPTQKTAPKTTTTATKKNQRH